MRPFQLAVVYAKGTVYCVTFDGNASGVRFPTLVYIVLLSNWALQRISGRSIQSTSLDLSINQQLCL